MTVTTTEGSTTVIGVWADPVVETAAAPVDAPAAAAGDSVLVEGVVVTDDGASLAVTAISGTTDAPSIVLVHGWGAARPMWREVVSRLVTQGRSIVLYDLRGHGASTTGTDGISIDRLGRDLAAVIAALGLTDVVIAGHSGGGYSTLSFLIDHPPATTTVHGLALIATAASGQKIPPPERFLQGSRLMDFAASRSGLGTRILRHTTGPACPPEMLEQVRLMFAATGRRARRAAFSSTTKMDFRSGLAGLAIPTVVLAGDHDHVVKPKYGQELADALPDASYDVVANAGHMLPLEAPDVLAVRIDGLRPRPA